MGSATGVWIPEQLAACAALTAAAGIFPGPGARWMNQRIPNTPSPITPNQAARLTAAARTSRRRAASFWARACSLRSFRDEADPAGGEPFGVGAPAGVVRFLGLRFFFAIYIEPLGSRATPM